MSLRRNFDLVVEFDKLDPERMRPGLSARVVIQRETAGDALLVPRAALDFTDPKTTRALLADGQLRPVTLGGCNAHDCVVRGGLTAGQKLAAVTEVKRG
jgi:multidrug efflux pump subunit AcrA (membrane-fusion protein)